MARVKDCKFWIKQDAPRALTLLGLLASVTLFTVSRAVSPSAKLQEEEVHGERGSRGGFSKSDHDFPL